jgi:hypothetical protein
MDLRGAASHQSTSLSLAPGDIRGYQPDGVAVTGAFFGRRGITRRMKSLLKPLWMVIPILGGCRMLSQASGLPTAGQGALPQFTGKVATSALNAQDVFRKFNIEPFFLKNRAFKDWIPYEDSYQNKHLTNRGKPLSRQEIEGLKHAATLMAYNESSVKHVPGRPAQKTAQLLNQALDKLLSDNGYTEVSKDMRGILEIRASSGWTRRYTTYQMRELGRGSDLVNTSKLLAGEYCPVICTDSTVIARNIAREMSKLSGSGLKAYMTEGQMLLPLEVRQEGQVISHGWVGGILASGMKMPSDPTPGSKEEQKNTDWSKVGDLYKDCPTDELSAERFMAYYCDNNDNRFIEQNKERVAKGLKPWTPRNGIELRQGDLQSNVNLGNNLGWETRAWKRWLYEDQPHREKLIPIENWLKSQP